MFDEWVIRLDSTHNLLNKLKLTLDLMDHGVDDFCDKLNQVVSAQKENSLKSAAKLRQFALCSPALGLDNHWSLFAVRLVEVFTTDANNLGRFQTLVLSVPDIEEIPYPPGVACLIRQRIKSKLSIIDEDFVILNSFAHH